MCIIAVLAKREQSAKRLPKRNKSVAPTSAQYCVRRRRLCDVTSSHSITVHSINRSDSSMCRLRIYPSRIATARVQPAEARSIFTGKHDTMNPVEGSCSRLFSFSMWQ